MRHAVLSVVSFAVLIPSVAAQDMKPKATLKFLDVQAVAFTKDGKTLLAAGGSHVKSWDLAELKEVASDKTEWVARASFTADGKLAALTSRSKQRVWDMAGRKEVQSLPQPADDDLVGLALSPDGKTLALGTARQGELGTVSGLGAELRLYDAKTGKLKDILLKNSRGAIWASAFSPDGALLAHGGGSAGFSGEDGHAKLWDVAKAKESRALKHDRPVLSLAFSGDGKTLASGTYENAGRDQVGVVKLWKVANGDLLQTLKGYKGPVYAVALSPEGRIVAWGGYDGVVKISDAKSGKELAVLNLKGVDTSGIRSLAFSPDGNTLATASTIGIQLWDIGALTGPKR